MGREIKRVVAGFDWPMEKIWSGFQNPHYEGHCKQCELCEGSGLSPQANYLKDQWYGNAPFQPRSTGSELLTETHSYVRAFAEKNCNGALDFYGNNEPSIRREARRLAALWNGQWSVELWV